MQSARQHSKTPLLKRCTKQCCSFAFWYWAVDPITNTKYQALLPLKKV